MMARDRVAASAGPRVRALHHVRLRTVMLKEIEVDRGELRQRIRIRKGKRLADDLPLVAEEYRRLVTKRRRE